MADAPEYPATCRIFIDNKDATQWIFKTSTFSPDKFHHVWRNIDLTNFIKSFGVHKIRVTCETGIGRCEGRIEVR